MSDAAPPPDADAQFVRDLYSELRSLAEQHLRGERVGHTLQPTALVHEAWTRLSSGQPLDWSNRAHVFAAAARAMRQTLIDHARRRGRVKRGGSSVRRADVPLDALTMVDDSSPSEILDLEEAMQRLEEVHDEAFRVIQLRFYAGLTREECAELLEITPRQIDRLWMFARAWLQRELARDEDSST
jgi:RNA polymerase sigma factor (TIGR02999 family)